MKKLVECLTAEREELSQHLKICQEDIMGKVEEIRELRRLISDLQAQMEAKDGLVSQLDQKVSEYVKLDDQNKLLLVNTRLEIEHLSTKLDGRNKVISQMEDDVYFLKATVEGKDGEIQELNKDLSATNDQLEEKEMKITTLEK